MTLINKLITICPVPVLIFGLISCSPDRAEKDSLTIQEPEIVTDKSLPVKVSNLEPNFIWSVRDRIRFQELNRDNLKVSIQSSCVSAQSREVFDGSQIRPLPKELLIGELLPPSLLTRKNPAALNPFHCSFAFTAVNDKGSRHKFKLPPRLLEEPPHAGYQTTLQINGAPVETKPGEWPAFNSSDLEKVWVMSPRADQFQLKCTDLQVTSKTKTDLISVSELIKGSEAAKVLPSIQKAPMQSCRILAFEGGLLQGWSPYFKAHWSASKLEIQATRQLGQEYWRQTYVGSIQKLYEVRIKNPYAFPVYFTIPEQKQIWVFAMLTDNLGHKYKEPFSITYDKSAPGLILSEKKPFRIGLNPGAQVTLQLQTRFTRSCGTNILGYVYPFHSAANLKITRFLDMTEDLEVGTQDLVPAKIISIKGGHVSGFTPIIPDSYDPPDC